VSIARARGIDDLARRWTSVGPGTLADRASGVGAFATVDVGRLSTASPWSPSPSSSTAASLRFTASRKARAFARVSARLVGQVSIARATFAGEASPLALNGPRAVTASAE
jgi:hypothetical protein